MKTFLCAVAVLVFGTACGVDGEAGALLTEDGYELEVPGAVEQGVSCAPRMSLFPVAAAHNIGYDAKSCSTGTCRTSCPDQNANSDWNGPAGHHGIDVFAFRRAPLVAVADGTIISVGVASSTSGIRINLRDACNWNYYYGHLDQAVVKPGQRVSKGQLLGYMGNTGTGGVHLHFNISADGNYSRDINPFNYLKSTSPTACGGGAPAPAPNPEPPAPVVPGPTGCGTLQPNQALGVNEALTSCDNRFTLVMQGDGNLVLYKAGRALWHTSTHGRGGQIAAMQGDGNFVVYAAGGRALWHTSTHGKPGAVLALQNDGNLVIYQGNRALWSSGTHGN